MELIQIGTNTYYLKNNTNIGIYKINESEVYLIDTGNDSDAGKKILKAISNQNWTIKGIINTHSHADHIGGNKIIQDRTKTDIYANNLEGAIINNPILSPSQFYGAYPFKEFQNKVFMAEKSTVTKSVADLPKCLEYFKLPGHSLDMIGIKTPDDIYFLGDSLISSLTINKYHLFYIYNVEEYLNTLDYLSTLKGKLFIPSHTEPLQDITDLINLNRNKIKEVYNTILQICTTNQNYENILKEIFNYYHLHFNLTQYLIIGSTLKAYLSYLYTNNKLKIILEDNQLLWEKNTP